LAMILVLGVARKPLVCLKVGQTDGTIRTRALARSVDPKDGTIGCECSKRRKQDLIYYRN
jgi:hypothetical protein